LHRYVKVLGAAMAKPLQANDPAMRVEYRELLDAAEVRLDTLLLLLLLLLLALPVHLPQLPALLLTITRAFPCFPFLLNFSTFVG
jgi:hypothetical protein